MISIFNMLGERWERRTNGGRKTVLNVMPEYATVMGR
jgi:hypothetical protein